MKKIIQYILLTFILLIFSHCEKTESEKVYYDQNYISEIKNARKETVFFTARNYIPGATLTVAKNGKIIYSEGWGFASKDLEVPATRKTKFRIGNLSELYTSAIYLKMVEDDLLHPDSTVQHYLPEFPEKKYPITLQHLADHTSGIREPTFYEKAGDKLIISLKNGIKLFENDSLLYAPETFQIQTIFNYMLLGSVMENVTDKNFNYLLNKYLTDTLGLESTVVDNQFTTIKNRSDFYISNLITQVINATVWDMQYRAPSDGILSNAEDLVKFGNAILYSDYFSEEFKNLLFKQTYIQKDLSRNMSNSWINITDKNGREAWGKSGSVNGGSAALLIYPEEKLVVAMATNLSSVSEDFPVFTIANFFLSNK